jgi:adenosylcobinamide-phosphate synthase
MASALLDMLPWLVLPTAFLLDACFGDPRQLPHPVRWMGRAIEIAEPVFRRAFAREVLAGLALCCHSHPGMLGTGCPHRWPGISDERSPGFRGEAILLFYCFSARSLAQAGMEIYGLLVNRRG